MSFMFLGTVKISAKPVTGQESSVKSERLTYDFEVVVRGTKS